jgi:uncharacterized protein YigA (DUF484 family)
MSAPLRPGISLRDQRRAVAEADALIARAEELHAKLRLEVDRLAAAGRNDDDARARLHLAEFQLLQLRRSRQALPSPGEEEG